MIYSRTFEEPCDIQGIYIYRRLEQQKELKNQLELIEVIINVKVESPSRRLGGVCGESFLGVDSLPFVVLLVFGQAFGHVYE